MKRRPLVLNGNIIEQLQPADYIENSRLNIGPKVQLTMISNQILITKSFHAVYFVGSTAASRRLHTINGGIAGDILILTGTDDGNDISVRDNDGNLRLAGDFTLSSSVDAMTLLFDGANWIEMARSNNG